MQFTYKKKRFFLVLLIYSLIYPKKKKVTWGTKVVDKFSKSRSVDAIFTSGSWVRFIMNMVGEESAKCIKRRWAVTPWKTCKPLIDVLYWVFLGTVLLHAYILMISLLLQWFFNQWECMTIWFMSFLIFLV